MPDSEDIFVTRNPTYLRTRVERTIKFVSRKTMGEYEALGGETLEEAGIDPDASLPAAHAQVVKQWAAKQDGLQGYLAQWGYLDGEIAVIHHVKVYVDGELVHEEDLI